MEAVDTYIPTPERDTDKPIHEKKKKKNASWEYSQLLDVEQCYRSS